MSDDPFDDPGSLSAIKVADHEGQLLLVWPQALQRTERLDGEGDVVLADVVVIDYPGGAIEYKSTIIFPKMIIGQVRRNIGTGRPNLGRVGKGEAKKGQSQPWILLVPTEADKRAARAYLDNPAARPAEQVLNGMGAGAGAGGHGANQAPPF